MATTEVGTTSAVADAPPDTRGKSSLASATALALGIIALTAVLGGTIVLQLDYGFSASQAVSWGQ